jgi:hypothetical protein
VKRALLALAAVAAAGAVAASPAAATNECKGLMICVPIAGPWVLAAPGQVEFQLACPKNFIVGGLDAELSSRGIEIGFVGSLGSPVNPGVTTSKEAVFLGRLVRGRDPAPAFRPHIGCVPASGGGARVPTAYHVFAPGKPSLRRVTQVVVGAGGRRTLHRGCARGERLVAATHAIGFATPPTAAQAGSIHVTQHVAAGIVTLHIASRTRALVQLDLICGAR